MKRLLLLSLLGLMPCLTFAADEKEIQTDLASAFAYSRQGIDLGVHSLQNNSPDKVETFHIMKKDSKGNWVNSGWRGVKVFNEGKLEIDRNLFIQAVGNHIDALFPLSEASGESSEMINELKKYIYGSDAKRKSATEAITKKIGTDEKASAQIKAVLFLEQLRGYIIPEAYNAHPREILLAGRPLNDEDEAIDTFIGTIKLDTSVPGNTLTNLREEAYHAIHNGPIGALTRNRFQSGMKFSGDHAGKFSRIAYGLGDSFLENQQRHEETQALLGKTRRQVASGRNNPMYDLAGVVRHASTGMMEALPILSQQWNVRGYNLNPWQREQNKRTFSKRTKGLALLNGVMHAADLINKSLTQKTRELTPEDIYAIAVYNRWNKDDKDAENALKVVNRIANGRMGIRGVQHLALEANKDVLSDNMNTKLGKDANFDAFNSLGAVNRALSLYETYKLNKVYDQVKKRAHQYLEDNPDKKPEPQRRISKRNFLDRVNKARLKKRPLENAEE